MWDAIYIAHQLEVAVAVGHISAWASVLPVVDCRFNRSLIALK